MSTEARRKSPGRFRDTRPVFMKKSELAYQMGEVDTKTIDEWVKEGIVPPPHSRLGERTAVWLRAHWDAYVRSGAWPAESWGKGGAT